MKLLVVGLNHKTAPVALREQLSFSGERLDQAMAELTALPAVAEAVIVSTCNRVELYLASRNPAAAAVATTSWLAEFHAIPMEQLEEHLYLHRDNMAILHGFRVAASLDSMVVGEPQILGQMKQAFQQAVTAKICGLILTKYFHKMFQVAKLVRSETAIAENAVSVAYAAVELARKIFGKLEGRTCLLIGAGEMCEAAARHLVSNGIHRVLVTNRTLDRAIRLAEAFDGHAFPLEELAENLDQADIVISSTGSTVYLVTGAMVTAALRRRRQRPMFFIDIAVPRDIDPRVGEIDSAFLYDMDDLVHVVEHNRKERNQAAQQAETIIAEAIPSFVQWLESLEVVPTLVALRQQVESLRDHELARFLASWPDLSAVDQQRIERFTRLLVNKILHNPTSRLRTMAANGNEDLYVDAVRQLFDLMPSEISPMDHPEE
jgi:glutamyl-tRNA reductase